MFDFLLFFDYFMFVSCCFIEIVNFCGEGLFYLLCGLVNIKYFGVLWFFKKFFGLVFVVTNNINGSSGFI